MALPPELREWDGFPRAGPNAAMASLAVPFRDAGVAAAASSVRVPQLADPQVGSLGV